MNEVIPETSVLQYLQHLSTLTYFSPFSIIYFECHAANIYFVTHNTGAFLLVDPKWHGMPVQFPIHSFIGWREKVRVLKEF